jgi:hypothetical protein
MCDRKLKFLSYGHSFLEIGGINFFPSLFLFLFFSFFSQSFSLSFPSLFLFLFFLFFSLVFVTWFL